MHVVTFNLQFAHRLDRAIEVMRGDPALHEADLIAVQEVDDRAVEVLAGTFGLHAAWYPAAIHRRTGRWFAPAVLSRRPIASHERIDLPHTGLHGLRRIAVRSRIQAGEGDLEFVSVHFGTMREILPGQQAAQAREVLEAVRGVSGPVVIAGDLNRRGLGRLFEQSGFHWATRGVGLTHHIWSFDHIFVRGLPGTPARAGSVKAALAASDHRAVWARFDPP